MVRHAMIAANTPVAIAIRSTVAHFMVVNGPYASRNPICSVHHEELATRSE